MAAPATAHQFAGLIGERRFADAEQAVRAKLQQDPRNTDALAASVELVLAQRQEERLPEALRWADACIAYHPAASECHEARASVLAEQAMAGNLLDALLAAGKVIESYQRAIVLDARNYRARVALLRTYLKVPFVVGGGVGRARALADETGRIHPDVSNLMQGFCDLEEGRLAKAETLALSLNLAGAENVIPAQAQLLWNLGRRLLSDRKLDDAQRVFGELRQRFPSNARGYYGLARVAQEEGRHSDALPLFENALSFNTRAEIYLGLGLSALAMNDRARATSALRQAVNSKPPLPKDQRSEAMSKLAQLQGH